MLDTRYRFITIRITIVLRINTENDEQSNIKRPLDEKHYSPTKKRWGGGLTGNEKHPYLVPQISAKTKSPYLHKGVTKMFYMNPFRKIKDLEFDVDVRDRVIENLKKEIEELSLLQDQSIIQM